MYKILSPSEITPRPHYQRICHSPDLPLTKDQLALPNPSLLAERFRCASSFPKSIILSNHEFDAEKPPANAPPDNASTSTAHSPRSRGACAFSLKNIIWCGVSVLGTMAVVYGTYRWRSSAIQNAAEDINAVKNTLSPVSAKLTGNAINAGAHDDMEMMQGDQPLPEYVNSPYSAHISLNSSESHDATLLKTNKEIIRLLKKNHLLDQSIKPLKVSTAALAIATAKYLTQEGDANKNTFARLILKTAERYGGHRDEPLTLKQIDQVIRTWLFSNLLGNTPDMFVAHKAATDNYPFMFTVDSLRYLLSLESLWAEQPSFTSCSESERQTFSALWQRAIEQEIPLLTHYVNHGKVKFYPLTDFRFSALFTGSLFLYEQGFDLKNITLDEAIITGEAMWETASNAAVNVDMLRFHTLPAMLFNAIHAPDKNFADSYQNPFMARTLALTNYFDYLDNMKIAEADLAGKLDNYKNAVNHWRTRGQLADKILEMCPPESLRTLPSLADGIMTADEKSLQNLRGAKEAYLNGYRKPCNSAPDYIDVEYAKEANTLAQIFSALDEVLIKRAFEVVLETERDFISNEKNVIHSLKIVPFLKIQGIAPFINDNNQYLYDFSQFKNNDVFSITYDNETRVYALAGERSRGYDIIRFDLQIPNELHEHVSNFHPSIGYTGNNAAESVIKSSEQHSDILIAYLKNKHHSKFYDDIYLSGYTESDLQTIWGYVKNIIPFYNCIAESIAKNVEKAVPACLLDAVSLIFVASRAAGLTGRFGMSAAHGLYRGHTVLAKNPLTLGSARAFGVEVIKHTSLPTFDDLSSLGKGVLRAVDPGFELATTLSKKGLNKLVSFLERHSDDAQINVLLNKIKAQTLQQNLPNFIEPDYTLALPQTTLHMPFKKIGTHQGRDVVAAINPETGELFGKRFQVMSRALIQAVSAYQRDSHILAQITQFQQLKPPQHQLTRPDIALARQQMDQLNNPLPGSSSINNNPVVTINHIPDINRFLAPLIENPLLYSYVKYDRIADFENAAKGYYGTNDIYMIRCGENINNVPIQWEYLKQNIVNFNNFFVRALSNAKKVHDKFARFRRVNGVTQFPNNNRIKRYLSEVLETTDAAILDQAQLRLKYYADNIYNYFKGTDHNVLLATCDRWGHAYTHNPQSPLGFTYRDDIYNRVVILVDNFKTAPILSAPVHYTMLHEVSHHYGTLDFMMAPSTAKVGDASEYMEVFEDGIHVRNKEFINIEDDFITAYNFDHPNTIVTKTEMVELLKRDPMLKANAFMENADFVARMISDIAEDIPASRDYMPDRRKRSADNVDVLTTSDDNTAKILEANVAALLYKLSMKRS